MQEFEKSNTKLLTEIQQLQTKLNILLSSTLFNSISAKLSKSPDAPNILEILKAISKEYYDITGNPSPPARMVAMTNRQCIEEYANHLAEYYEEMIKVLDENITQKQAIATKLSQEKKETSAPASNEKRGKGQQLFLKIQAM